MWIRFWHRFERCLIYNFIRLFRLRSATEHVARGFAIGLVVNFFPTFGIGMLISGAVAKAAGGSMVAGLVGGASLSLVWPFLFYLNLRTGSVFVRPTIIVNEFEELTEKTMSALKWGQTFTLGAILNSVMVGLAAYFSLLFLYHRIRPQTLTYLRRHAREHQRRFRRLKPRPRPRTVEGDS